MGILTAPDKEKIKRAVPKASNKIIDATVARLYVAYPNTSTWTYTGLSGAIALVDDLVGHTFFLKLVDISGARGVLWDQELYVDFSYHQDRTFFHTFEMEECLAGLLFEDTHDAAHFYKRVSTRHKHGSKQTVNNKNAVALKSRMEPESMKSGSRGEYVDPTTGQRSRRARGVLYYDDSPPPEWRSLYNELAAAGISEDMIAENREFIKSYIAKQGGPLVGLEPPIPRRFSSRPDTSGSGSGAGAGAGAGAGSGADSMHDSASVSTSIAKKKKAPPPPPPPASAVTPESSEPSPAPETRASSPDSEPVEHVQEKSRFRVPPLNAPIPPHTNSQPPPPPTNPALPSVAPMQASQSPSMSNPPPPPPRAPGRAVPPPPPPRAGQSAVNNGPLPPVPPARGAPPPPPPRSRALPQVPQPSQPSQPPQPPQPLQPPVQQFQPPQPPIQSPVQPVQQSAPPPPARGYTPIPVKNFPPPPKRPEHTPPQKSEPSFSPPQNEETAPVPTQNTTTPPPPPPPPMAQNAAPPPPPPPPMAQNGSQNGPPSPPLPPNGALSPNGNGPPPPPLPPADTSASPSLPVVDSSRDALLASIRGAGIGGLKKTDKSALEKPNVLLQEARGEPIAPPASSSSSGQPETLADALASALNKRKGKVAESDDDDENDDW